MSDQKQDDWKEGRIAEYAKLEREIDTKLHEMEIDPQLNKFLQEQAALNLKMEAAKAKFLKNIEAAQQQQAGIKQELAEKWGIKEDKTFECRAGKATLRVNRSFVIRNKEKLIDFLTLNNKLIDFIRTFDISKLRKIKDAGMLGDEIATYEETKTIAIKLTEAEK